MGVTMTNVMFSKRERGQMSILITIGHYFYRNSFIFLLIFWFSPCTIKSSFSKNYEIGIFYILLENGVNKADNQLVLFPF